MKEKVEKFNESMDLNILQADGQRPPTSQTQQPAKRLHCQPIFDASEAPLNMTKVALPPDVSAAADFEAKHEPLGLNIV